MIPIKLSLKNFMSYKELEFDFSEIHVACLSGDNGAGKSTILDAITWCLWDNARSSNKEDLIRLGESEMNAEFIFSVNDAEYRVLRGTKKTKKLAQSTLEFQVLAENGYRSITGKSVRETQTKIIETIKTDYNTFVNSAFILQGKADQFTTQKPSERKEVLADILNLSQYDKLEEKAREKLREFEKEKKQIEELVIRNTSYFADEEDLKEKSRLLNDDFEVLDEQIQQVQSNLKKLSEDKEFFNNKLSTLYEINKSYLHDKKELVLLETEIAKLNTEIELNNKIVADKEDIEKNYKLLHELKDEESICSNKLIKFSEIEKEGSELREEIKEIKHKLNLEYHKLEDKLNTLNKDKSEQDKVLKDKDKIFEAYEKYKLAKDEELEYQQKSVEHHKLTDEKYDLEKELQKELQKLKIKESELNAKIFEKEKDVLDIVHIKESINSINQQLKQLELKSTKLDSVSEEGQRFKAEIEGNKKIISLKNDEIELYSNKIKQWKEMGATHCPMCETFLDENDKKALIEKYQKNLELSEHEKDELVVSNSKLERQITEKRLEFNQLKKELEIKDTIQKKLGEYEQKLQKADFSQKELETLKEELQSVVEKIINKDFSQALKANFDLVIQKIQALNFSNEQMALIQAKVNDWKWSEIKNSQIQQAENKLKELNFILPEVQMLFEQKQKDIEEETFTKEKELKLKSLYAQARELNYDKNRHQELKALINNLRAYENKWNLLTHAVSKLLSLNNELARINVNKEKTIATIEEKFQKINEIQTLETNLKDLSFEIEQKNLLVDSKNKKLLEIKTEIIKIAQRLEHYSKLKEEIEENTNKIKGIDHEIRLYKELVTAFGKKGIQALIIENAIPEIENMANRLLNKMTEGRMTVSFNTRKENKSNEKIVETLDIFISDELGTRNYEMYSGGEAFRVNFAIRLALSKLLARRAGTNLKTLVIDEGFGTQDSKGISRLIEAINIVSDDFEKIIIITHMNELKEAFPTRIEVFKTIHGSQIRLMD